MRWASHSGLGDQGVAHPFPSSVSSAKARFFSTQHCPGFFFGNHHLPPGNGAFHKESMLNF